MKWIYSRLLVSANEEARKGKLETCRLSLNDSARFSEIASFVVVLNPKIDPVILAIHGLVGPGAPDDSCEDKFRSCRTECMPGQKTCIG